MSIFYAEAREVSPLRIQLDPDPNGSLGTLLEYTAGTDTAVGGYSIPVLSREVAFTAIEIERLSRLNVINRSGFASPRCAVYSNFTTSDPSTIGQTVTPFFLHWAAPSKRDAFIVGSGGGMRLSAKSVDTTWTAAFLWEEI